MPCRYYAAWRAARPESYREDTSLVTHMERAGLLHHHHHHGGAYAHASASASASGVELPSSSSSPASPVSPSAAAAAQKYCELASAAESGWDFSSRWALQDECPSSSSGGSGGSSSDDLDHAHIEPVLVATATTRVIPADLNGLLFRFERDAAEVASRCGDAACAQRFGRLAAARLVAMDALMWDDAAGCWRDLHLARGGYAQQQQQGAAQAAMAAAAASAAVCTASSPAGMAGGGLPSSVGVGADLVGVSTPQQPGGSTASLRSHAEPQPHGEGLAGPAGAVPPLPLLPRHYHVWGHIIHASASTKATLIWC
jgi:neutral trehalase